jgi:CRP/FNR family transcriptional regulator, anaerobic regulatory protein
MTLASMHWSPRSPSNPPAAPLLVKPKLFDQDLFIDGKTMVAVQTLRRIYAAFPDLQALPDKERQLLNAHLTLATHPSGSIILDSGQTCDGLVLCVSGAISITTGSHRKLVLHSVRAGQICPFTTLALLTSQSLIASSQASEITEAAVIPKAAFDALMHKSPGFQRFVLTSYLDLLPRILALINQLAFASVDQRLAETLLTQGGRSGRVGKTHREIAIDIGTVREIVSHTLSDWTEAGWVQTGRGSVQILNATALTNYLTQHGRQ